MQTILSQIACFYLILNVIDIKDPPVLGSVRWGGDAYPILPAMETITAHGDSNCLCHRIPSARRARELRGKLHGLCHGSIPSSAGASVKPKASQASICFDNVIYCIWLIDLIKTPMGCFAHFLGMVFMRWNRERFFMTCGVFEKEPLPTPGAFLCSGHGLAFA